MKILGSALLYCWVLVNFVVFSIPFILVNAFLKLTGQTLWYEGTELLGEYMLYVHGIKVTMTGSFPKNGNFVIIANHTSYLDIFLVAKAMGGRTCSACGAHWVFWIPLLGWILKLFDVVPLWRHDHERAVEGIEKAKILAHVKKCDMIILPEGTRTITGEVGPFKMGPFHVAIDVGLDIVPVYFVGAFEAKPKNRFTFRNVPLHIHVGEPIRTFCYKDPKQLRDAVEEYFRSELMYQKLLHPVHSL